MKNNNNLLLIILMCLTLGLAPFRPEPHIVGKIRWVMGGAKGMELMDWFDLVLHGTPWVLLIGYLAVWLFSLLRSSAPPSQDRP